MFFALFIGFYNYAEDLPKTPNKHMFVQSVSMQIASNEKTMFLSYKGTFNRYNSIKLWYDLQQEECKSKEIIRYGCDYGNELVYRYGGGIESPVAVVGTYYEQGLYKIFNDISTFTAWDNTPYTSTRWTIRTSPVNNPDYGVRVALPYTMFDKFSFDSRNAIASLYVGKKSNADNFRLYGIGDNVAYNIGMSLGYNLERSKISWEPYFLYKYSKRQALPLSNTAWQSWYLEEPTSLELSQLLMSQKIKIKKYGFIQALGLASLTDTTALSTAGNLLLHLDIAKISISLNAGTADKDGVGDEWKYYKYLWTTSCEAILYYYRASYLKTRGQISEYNLIHDNRVYPQSLKKYYLLEWEHQLDLLLIKQKIDIAQKISIIPHVEYVYSYDEFDEYHKIKLELVSGIKKWRPLIRYQFYWYIDEESRLVKKNTMKQTLGVKYAISKFDVTLEYRNEWDIDWEPEYMNDNMLDAIYDRTNVISHRLLASYKIKGLFLSASILLESKKNKSIEKYKYYNHELIGNIQVRYNW